VSKSARYDTEDEIVKLEPGLFRRPDGRALLAPERGPSPIHTQRGTRAWMR
jgi:hypothetical protein